MVIPTLPFPNVTQHFTLSAEFLPQSPIPASTTLILIGALILVLIVLVGVLWVSSRKDH
jgi:hypothetical protein